MSISIGIKITIKILRIAYYVHLYLLNNKLKQITIFNNRVLFIIEVVYFIMQKLITKYGLDIKIKSNY